MTYILQDRNNLENIYYFYSEEELTEWVDYHLSWVERNCSESEWVAIDPEGREWLV